MRQFLIVCTLLVGPTAVYAADPRAPRDEEVAFQSGSLTIAGTLSLPAGRGPFPTVVLLSGSGPQNRDSELLGFRPFKQMADFFVARGIAVLRCDDRGVGGSSGRLAASTTQDLADDALAAVGLLRARSDIDRARIGLLGHSEGAIVAAIAASRSPDVAFIVWMAGSAIRGDEIMRGQAADLARAAGVDAAGVDRITLETALARAGNDRVTMKVYPEANHLFQPAVTGNPTEYATLPKTFVAPLLDDIAAWIVKQ